MYKFSILALLAVAVTHPASAEEGRGMLSTDVVEAVPITVATDDQSNSSHGPSPDAAQEIASSDRWEKTTQAVQDFLQSYIEIRDVTIEGTYRLSSATLSRELGLSQPVKIWELDKELLERRLRTNPWIESASITVDYLPPALRIKLREEEPWLVADIAKERWIIARSGRLLQTVSTLNYKTQSELVDELSLLPQVLGLNGNTLSNSAFKYAVDSLKLIEVAGGLPFQPAKVEVMSDAGIALSPLESDFTVYFLATDLTETRTKLKMLNATLNDLKRGGETPLTVDLRFAQQAIVRTAQPATKAKANSK